MKQYVEVRLELWEQNFTFIVDLILQDYFQKPEKYV